MIPERYHTYDIKYSSYLYQAKTIGSMLIGFDWNAHYIPRDREDYPLNGVKEAGVDFMTSKLHSYKREYRYTLPYFSNLSYY